MIPKEFVESVQEEAEHTIDKCLEAIRAPRELTELVRSARDLDFLWRQTWEIPPAPSDPMQEVQSQIAEVVNLIVECGGSFHSTMSHSLPREGSILDGAEA